MGVGFYLVFSLKCTVFENHPKIAFEFWHFPPIFGPIIIDLSGTTVWQQASGFQKLAKMDHFGYFWWTFVYLKCKHSSLRSQCWMRLFLWFSNTVKLFSFCWCVIVWFSMGFAKVKALLFLTSTSFESASLLSNLTPAPTFHFYSISSEHLPLLSKHSKMLWFWFKEC